MPQKVMRAVFAIMLLGSLAVLSYLNASDALAQYDADRKIERMSALYDDEDDPIRLEYKQQAQWYNAQVAGFEVAAKVLPYAKQLFYLEEPMISYIEIPAISVKLPIYHGVEENALMAGVGHLEGSSLPVGGASSHCVLLGHSGMRNTRMFDDLRRLGRGDLIVVRTLNDPYAYRVTETETCLPEEVSGRIGVVPGEDMVTLVTCVPIGVNSHRLLVHAVRCEYSPEEAADVGIDAYVNDRNLPLIAGMCVAAALGAAALVSGMKRRRRGHAGKR